MKSADQKGLAVFTLVKGGLMYEASVGGQKFSYTPRATTGEALAYVETGRAKGKVVIRVR